MEAGRELDALVAEKVMGLARESLYDKFTGKLLVSEHWGPPFFSSDISDAWQVFTQFTSRFIWYDDATDTWHCHLDSTRRVMDDCRHHECADTAPHAICLAALKAVGYKEEA